MDEHGIEDHPDLMDPNWQRHAEKEAWTELRRNRRRSRRGKRIAWSAAIAVVLVAAVFGVSQWGRNTVEHYDPSAPGISATTPSAPSVLPEIASVDLSKPFDHTPAQAWAEGTDGLSVPAAVRTGSFSATQVQGAYDKVKQVIAAAELDRRMLQQHDTSAYLALLAENERNRIRPILADRSKNDFSGYVTLIADGFHLLAAGPKITGRLSVRPGDSGELIVHAEYIVGYAFDPGSHGPITSPGEIDAFQRHQDDFSILTSPPYRKSDAGLVIDGSTAEVYSMACAPSKAGYLAPSYSEETPGGSAPSNEAAIFDVNQPMPQDDNC